MSHLLRGRYEQLEVVGAGGQGRVVKALDHLHDRPVALKVRAVGSQADHRALLAEARILFDLPPIPQLPIVRDDFFDGDDYVIVMDWVEGANLDRILHIEGRPGLPPTLVLAWMADAAAALTHLHMHDPPVFHGDVKPANLILTKGGRVAMVDFGASSSTTAPGRRGGTPGFAAPERSAAGASTRAADIYSLAATAFALLTGGPPTGIRPTWEGIDPTLAEQLEAAIREGLSTAPDQRPGTPGEFVEKLRAGWSSSLPTGVLTFCFTDIVGSTGLWETQPVAMSQALVLHDKTIATAAERQGGRLIDSMGEGDSTVSVFDSPIAAVTAAIDLTRALEGVSWPNGLAIRARAALHTGETEQRGGTYFGLTMSTAARLRGLADGGQVYLSKDTAALVRGHLPPDTALVDLGPTKLRGHSEREHVFALAAPGVDAPPPGTDCPYPGLIAFGPEDADRYFGRQTIVGELLERLRSHPFVAVIGASGSGKSSLLRAGVAPRWLAGADFVTPGGTRLVDSADADSDRLLVVDQFEELFTQVEPAERAAFVESLLDTRRPVALALRADFYGACATFSALAGEVASHQVLLGPMAADELRAAIVEPALAAGLRIEPALVEVLVGEVQGEPGALPLLAHALRATWEQRDGRTLTLDAYRATGGVTSAIGKTADQVLASFDETDRDIAQHLLLRLVEPGDGPDDARRRATLTELRAAGASGDRTDRVISALVAARLVAVDEGTVQVAHEALIREWPQLGRWLADQRDDLRLQRQVTTAAEAWDSGGRDPSELYRGPRLARALEWLERRPRASETEEAFLRAAAAEEERVQRAQARTNRRLRTSLAGVAIALVLAMLGSGVAIARGRQAADSRDQADVARLAAVSRSLVERQPDVGLLLAVEAFDRQDSAETRSTLVAALEAHPLLDGLIYGTDSGLGTASFGPDAATLATTTSDGSGTILWDTATRRRVATLDGGDAIVLDASVSPDGRTLAAVAASFDPASGPTSHLQVWDLARQELVQHIESPAGNLTSVSFSRDGGTLVTQAGARFDAPSESHLVAVVWDTSTWTMRGEPWRLADEYVDDHVVVASRDSAVLVGPEGDGATVWDVASRSSRLHVPVLDGAVSALGLTSNGSIVAIGLDSGKVRLVDTTTGSVVGEMTTDPDVRTTSIEFSGDDSMLAVSNRGGRTQLFDVESGVGLGPPLAANSAAVNDVSFSADGRYLATTGRDRTGAIWRLDGNRAIGRSLPDHTSVATEVVVSRDGRYLLSGGADATLTVRDLHGRGAEDEVRSVARDGEVRSVGLDAGGTSVVTGDTAGAVTVASFPDLQTRRRHHFPGAWIWAAAFNPKTGVVAIAVDSTPHEDASQREEGFVALWDPVRDREVAPRIIEEDFTPVALGWSPDGKMLAVSSDNNKLGFYRRGSTYERIGDEPVIEDDNISALEISPDGATLAAGTSSGTVRQFEIATGRPFGPPLPGLGFEVRGVAYSRDGAMLAATAVGLSTSRLWDAATGARIGEELVAGRTPLTERTMGIDQPYPSRPAFSPDGNTLFTPVVDGSIVRWDLRPSEWVRAACRLAGRDLTRAEWREYLGDASYRRTCAR
ncbi:MAG TPA: protein kinase [Acidimicrobiales bacterium]|nr:protein kinase [Acidimicrobiales bacterium]